MSTNTKPYGYIVDSRGFNTLKFISALYLKNIKSRYALKPFKANGIPFGRGSFIVTRGDNSDIESKLDQSITELANKFQVKLTPAESGLVDQGKDFGSDYLQSGKKRNVALLCGEGTSPGDVGELWFFFEREIEYPVSMINTSDAGGLDLNGYDVLLMASGNYSKLKDTIVDFAKRGGRVVAFEDAISVFASEKSTSLFKAIETRNAEQKEAEKKEKSDDLSLLKKFEDERRYMLSERSAGSIYKVTVDTTNPFGFGLGREWFLMKRTKPYPFLTTGNNIGYILDNKPVSGFAGYKFQKQIRNTLVIGSERIGKGEVIYITDDPYFRAFWKSGRVLLWNVVFR